MSGTPYRYTSSITHKGLSKKDEFGSYIFDAAQQGIEFINVDRITVTPTLFERGGGAVVTKSGRSKGYNNRLEYSIHYDQLNETALYDFLLSEGWIIRSWLFDLRDFERGWAWPENREVINDIRDTRNSVSAIMYPGFRAFKKKLKPVRYGEVIRSMRNNVNYFKAWAMREHENDPDMLEQIRKYLYQYFDLYTLDFAYDCFDGIMSNFGMQWKS